MFDGGEGSDVLVGAQPFGRWKVEGEPPIAVVGGEEVAGGRVDVVAMEDAGEAVLDGGALFDQGATMGEGGAEFADGRGGIQTAGRRLAARSLARRMASCWSVLTAALAIQVTWRGLATTVRATRGATRS
jgi:hypothetical protein